MANENVIEHNPVLDKALSNIFMLCNTKKSSWQLEGTGEGTGVPADNMHTSQIMFLEVTSRLYLGKDKGYMPTAYVIGASTHYVHDYWEDKEGNPVFDKLTKEQGAAKGYEYRPGLLAIYGKDGMREEESRSKRKAICFEKGRLNLGKYGDDPVLRRFVAEHEQNKTAPRAAENRDPTRLKLFMFEPFVRENKAAKSKIVESFDESLEAMQFVGNLRKKTASGYSYNEATLDAVLSILEDGVGLAPGEVNQKFEIIARAAKADGGSFMKLINGAMEQYRIEIGKADALNVIEYTATEAKLIADGKKRTLHKFDTGASKDDAVGGLVLYFLGDKKGQADYKELKRQNEVAKIVALNKK